MLDAMGVPSVSATAPSGAQGSRMPLAVKTMGVSPVAPACSVLGPAALPRVHEPTVAIPVAPVVEVAPVIEPPPPVTLQVTVAPATPLPSASTTCTAGSCATGVATCAT